MSDDVQPDPEQQPEPKARRKIDLVPVLYLLLTATIVAVFTVVVVSLNVADRNSPDGEVWWTVVRGHDVYLDGSVRLAELPKWAGGER